MNNLNSEKLDHRVVVEDFKAYDSEAYEKIDLDRLAMIAVSELHERNIDLSSENAVVACFKLFPKKFALSGYPNYPDSDRIRNCLNRCTRSSKKWLSGKALHGFGITERSIPIVREARALLTGRKIKKTKATSQTRRKESLVAELKASSAFSKYSEKETDKVSAADLCIALQGTLDSSKEILRDNLNTLKTFATEIEDQKAAEFLDWLENKFKVYLHSN
jgi:hypothetical protein